MSQTYIAKDVTFGVVGYVTLLCDAIRFTPQKRAIFEEADVQVMQSAPALKVGRLACHVNWQGRGIGRALIRFSLETLTVISMKAGCGLLSVDSLPKAVPFYKSLGFVRNLHDSYQGRRRQTVSMRMSAFASMLPDWAQEPESPFSTGSS